MVRNESIAVILCTILLIAVFAPIVAGADHFIEKGQGGPRASSMTWSYVPSGYGTYAAKINNSGLKWLVLEVADNTTGIPELVTHQRIRFADYNAYPSGSVYSEPVKMITGRLYEITAIPNGPKRAHAVVSDEFTEWHIPEASFTIKASGLTVFVDASSSYDEDGNIVEYIWHWGDGETASGVTANHTYAMPGIYAIVLTVVDSTGLTDSMEATFHGDGPPPPPVPVATYAVFGLLLLVDGSASYDADGFIVSYFWDFGDGSTSYDPITSHEYAQAGYYLVTLVVTDDMGLSGAISSLIPVGDIFNIAPVASFSWDSAYFTVWADASASYDPDGFISDYLWDWGDGSSGSGVQASHTYSEGGNYIVTLFVIDDEGLTDTASELVYIGPDIVVMFSYSVIGLTVLVDASACDSEGLIVSYCWDWGDGTAGVGVTSTHTYALAGTYEVVLTMTDADGLIMTLAAEVTVSESV